MLLGMLKFQKKLTSNFWVFAPTRKRDAGRRTSAAGQNPGATKTPLRAGDKKCKMQKNCKKQEEENQGILTV